MRCPIYSQPVPEVFCSLVPRAVTPWRRGGVGRALAPFPLFADLLVMAYKRKRTGFRRRRYVRKSMYPIRKRPARMRYRRMRRGRRLLSIRGPFSFGTGVRRYRRFRGKRVSMKSLPRAVRPEVKFAGLLTGFAWLPAGTTQATDLYPWASFPTQGAGANQRIGEEIVNYKCELILRDIRIGCRTRVGNVWVDDTVAGTVSQNIKYRIMVVQWLEERDLNTVPNISEIMALPTTTDYWRSPLKKPSTRRFKLLYDKTFPLVKETRYAAEAIEGVPQDVPPNKGVTAIQVALHAPRTWRYVCRAPLRFQYDTSAGHWRTKKWFPRVYLMTNLDGGSLLNENVLRFDSEYRFYYTDA